MEHWTTEITLAVLSAFIVGVIVGYAFLKMRSGTVKKQLRLEAELKQTTETLTTQKAQLEAHFAESSELLKTLAEDYKKLYTHLASTSTRLLPEAGENSPFKQNAPLLEQDLSAKEVHIDSSDSQPKDYSGGSSGLLKS